MLGKGLVVATMLVAGMASAQTLTTETAAQKDKRMAWWREARFGMFIHWGLYSIPAGKWGNQNGYGEWLREEAQVPVGEYEKLQSQFNPVKFDANQWAKMAKDAGMKYVVITTKHHDGFNLFDSPYTDWSVKNTPFKRDVMAEMAKAVRGQGLKMGWYHSIMDWHHPDYLPRRSWEVASRPEAGANFDHFVDYLHNEVSYLLKNYGPISVLWFDGQWERTWNNYQGQKLYDLCRTIQPNLILNNRVGGDGTIGDYGTPEQYIPATGIPGDWETCMTMNGHWGYNAADTNWKSTGVLIKNLVDIASKGGNYLLNIGPKADGTFPDEAVERLKEIGDWMKVNGESIYGTTASRFEKLDFGRSTTKILGKNSRLYLHVLNWPTNGKLVLPGIGNRPLKAYVLAGHKPVVAKSDGAEITIDISNVKPDPYCTTLAVDLQGVPDVYRAPKILAPSSQFIDNIGIKFVSGSNSAQVRYTIDGSEPTGTSELARGDVTVVFLSSRTITAASFKGQRRVSPIAVQRFEKVMEWPALTDTSVNPGLQMVEVHGAFKTAEEVITAAASVTPVAAQKIEVAGTDKNPEEAVGRVYTGVINVPEKGIYEFQLASDDGSKLEIDDHVVVDNDGLHSSQTKSGTAPLAAGLHRFRLVWFNGTGGAQLELKWAPAGSELKPLARQ